MGKELKYRETAASDWSKFGQASKIVFEEYLKYQGMMAYELSERKSGDSRLAVSVAIIVYLAMSLIQKFQNDDLISQSN